MYLALGVFQWKTPSELGTEQNYAPPLYSRNIKVQTQCTILEHTYDLNLEGAKQCHGLGGPWMKVNH